MGEYIDRTALGIGYADPKAFINPAHADGWNTAVQIINEAPAVDVAPVVHAHWINPMSQDPECSHCGFSYEREQGGSAQTTDYCGGCGAKMDEEEHHV